MSYLDNASHVAIRLTHVATIAVREKFRYYYLSARSLLETSISYLGLLNIAMALQILFILVRRTRMLLIVSCSRYHIERHVDYRIDVWEGNNNKSRWPYMLRTLSFFRLSYFGTPGLG